MLKFAVLGLWVILVTAGSTFGSVYLRNASPATEANAPEDLGVEEVKAEMTSVPLVRGGAIVGYLIIQLSFQADRRLLEENKIEPKPYLNDAAFRVIFASTDIDFQRLRAKDLARLTDAIAEEANARLGMKLIRQVLIAQLNYVRKEDIRTNWIGQGNEQH
jgi:hypothetical protein